MSGISKINGSRGSVETIKRSRRRQSKEENWLGTKIDDFLENQVFGPKGSGAFYASSLGNNCDRFLYLHYHGLIPSDTIKPENRRMMDHGSNAEERWAKYFQGAGLLVARQIALRYPNPSISGKLDFQLTSPDGNKFVVEMKTTGSRNFQMLLEARSDHHIQLQIYLNLLNAPKGCVLYEDRDTMRTKFFYFNKDVNVWQGIIDRCNRIMQMSSIPKLEGVADKHDAKYCECLRVQDN